MEISHKVGDLSIQVKIEIGKGIINCDAGTILLIVNVESEVIATDLFA